MAKLAASTPLSPDANHLLGALPADDFDRLSGELELVPLRLGHALYESGSQLSHVYFPVSGLVSLLYTLADGNTAELAVVGRDGCVGMAILLGGKTTPSRAAVQIGGQAYRIPARAILGQFKLGGPIQLVLLRYIQALMTQMAQTAVCNRHHTVEEQLCRWLLLSLDRIDSDEVSMTQELISNMLGVRRTGITQAARTLQRAGLIEYRRGRIRIPDRARLEAHACECYSVVKNETDRLLRDAPVYGSAPHRQFGFIALR
jgi:CRP-like cAMP-binding protein